MSNLLGKEMIPDIGSTTDCLLWTGLSGLLRDRSNETLYSEVLNRFGPDLFPAFRTCVLKVYKKETRRWELKTYRGERELLLEDPINVEGYVDIVVRIHVAVLFKGRRKPILKVFLAKGVT